MKTWLILIIAALVLVAAAKRPRPVERFGRIAGQLTDDHEEAITGASIILGDTLIYTTTDAGGYYCLKNVPPGIYDISASIVGFTTVTAESLHVVADSIAIQNFQAIAQGVHIKDIIVPAQRQTVAHYPSCDILFKRP